MLYVVTLVCMMLPLLAACAAPAGCGTCTAVVVNTTSDEAGPLPHPHVQRDGSECPLPDGRGSDCPLPGGRGAGCPEPVRAVQATGIGHPPPGLEGARARLMARRAAEVVAARNLARKLGCRRRATLHGFRYVSTDHLPDGSVRVTVECPRSTASANPGPQAQPSPPAPRPSLRQRR